LIPAVLDFISINFSNLIRLGAEAGPAQQLNQAAPGETPANRLPTPAVQKVMAGNSEL